MSYFDKSLEIVKFVFTLSGITYKSKKLNTKEKLIVRSIYYFNFVSVNSDVVGAVYCFIDGVQTGKTFVELTYIAPCITFAILCSLKAFCMFHYEDHVSDLIDQLRDLDNKRKDESDIKKRETNFLHAILKASNIINLMLLLTFCVSPFILIAYKYVKTSEVELFLPLLIKYPFDSYDIKYWPYVYVHQFWSVVLVIVNLSVSDYLLFICCTYLRIQFRFLQKDIREIVTSNRKLTEPELVLLQEKIVNLVKWHQELIRLTGCLELIYAKSTLYNFVSSSVLICFTGFNVVTIDNVAFTIIFVVFLSTSLLQIFSLCFFGDLLMESSTEVRNAVYESKWYYTNTKAAKSLLIIQTRTDNPCKLTAFGFSEVNLKAFMSILSSAWSYFALLKTIYNED
uniref:Odorant receptor n=1 Tax=Heliconius melpomene rosina TaxID=171916 RepID=A0A1S5XXL3_HELME|nr:olfactory receptor 12 [Heliconius melpomene rosina]